MNFDSYIISDGQIEKIIYPLLILKENNKDYIIYSNTNNINDISDLFVAELTINDELLPVEDDMLDKFRKIVNKIFKELLIK